MRLHTNCVEHALVIGYDNASMIKIPVMFITNLVMNTKKVFNEHGISPKVSVTKLNERLQYVRINFEFSFTFGSHHPAEIRS